MSIDGEARLIEEGDRITEKKSRKGFDSLSSLEKAIYDFWIIDYAARNSGTLEPMRELSEISMSMLKEFTKSRNCHHLRLILDLVKDEEVFCNTYNQNFDNACSDLRYFDKNGK